MTSLFDPCSINYDDIKLSNLCEIFTIIKEHMKTSKQYKNLEKITLEQADSDKWMLYRAGKITSSNLLLAKKHIQ